MAGKEKGSYEARYTKPKLRERLKEEIKRSYERRGGGYNEEANREEAESLHGWTEQEWQTREGSFEAEGAGSMSRYLPKEAWQRLGPEERRRACASVQN